MATVPNPQLAVRYTREQAARSFGVIPVYTAVLLGYLMLLPPQVNLRVIGSLVPPYRLFLIAASIFIVASFIRGRFRFSWPDLAVAGATSWICFAMFMTSAQGEAITASLAHIADVALAYFFARAAFGNLRDLRMFLLLMLPGLFLVSIIMVLEAVTHTHIIQGIFSQITGRPVQYGSSPRLGLMRAQGPFPHPILAGIFLISFMPLYWLAGFKPWTRLAGSFSAFCSFVTVSSATSLGLVATIGVLAYGWLTKRVANLTWPLFFYAMATFIFVAELGTKSGTFALFVRYASLNSASAYNRVLIWRYGSENVAENPWFGIGYAEWTRPNWMSESMDNYWLLLAVRFGVPASVLVAIATLLALVMLMKKSTNSNPADADCERGVIIALAVFALGMISVSLWLATQVWFFVLLGLAVSLAHAGQNTTRQPYSSGYERASSSSRA